MPELKQEMYARDLLKKKASKTNAQTDWQNYKTKKNAVNLLIKKAKKTHYQNEIKNMGNMKGTWKVLNDIMGRKSKDTQINKINVQSPNESLKY